jgi:hypothetical protein
MRIFAVAAVLSLPLSLALPAEQTEQNDQPSCPQFCPMIYDPVCVVRCGEFSTFSNECVFRAETCPETDEYTIVAMEPCKQKSG